MIVDDNTAFRNALKFMLEKRTLYKVVVEAENGIQAIEKLSEIIPDLVLMDIEMPELNGIDATKIMLRKFSHIKCIALTMYKEAVYLNGLVEAGFKAFVYKPEIMKQLFVVIEAVMNDEFISPIDLKMKE